MRKDFEQNRKTEKYKSKYDGKTFEEVFGNSGSISNGSNLEDENIETLEDNLLNDDVDNEVEEDKKFAKEDGKRVTRKKKKRKKSKNHLLRILIVIVFVVGAILIMKSDYFTVEYIYIEGNSKYTEEELQSVGNFTTGGNLFFTEMGDAIDAVEELPYVENISIKRGFPNTIYIEIEERTPVLALSFDEKYLLVDSNDYVLELVDEVSDVTIMTDITIEKMDLNEKIEVEQENQYTNGRDVVMVAMDSLVFFKKIEVDYQSEDEINIKGYVENALTCQGEKEDMIEALENIYLFEVLDELDARGITRGTIEVTGEYSISFSPEIY